MSTHNFYDKCININNIKNAIRYVKTKYRINKKDEYVISEVKKSFRRYGKIDNNLCKITQRAIYQILEPEVSKFHIETCSGFKKDFQMKRSLSMIASSLLLAKNIFIIKVNLTNFNKTILLENLLKAVANITGDKLILKVLKYLILNYQVDEDLLNIIYDCYYLQIDNWTLTNISFEDDRHYMRDFEKHKDNYKEWRISRGKKPRARYFRFGHDFLFLCRSRSEQLWIIDELEKFFNNFNYCIKNDITINVNQLSIVGFFFKVTKKDRKYINIYIDKQYQVKFEHELKQFHCKSQENVMKFLIWFLDILAYYDIANNIETLLRKVGMRLFFCARHSSNFYKIDDLVKYKYKNKNEIIIDIYLLRKYMKMSYQYYLKKPIWMAEREKLKTWNLGFYSLSKLYGFALFSNQQGKDFVNGMYLNINHMNVHHIKAKKNGGNDELSNLILTSVENHKLIHSKNSVTNIKIGKLRKLV